ncbi:MAG: hypothetical protein ACXVNR_05700 [Bacteroidia bacterium]
MKKCFYIVLSLLYVCVKAQSITAWTDQRGYFNVFDNGNTSTIEYQMPQNFQVGGAVIAYHDFNSNFKVYYKGDVTTLYGGNVNKYMVTHNLLFYIIAGQLHVYDRGKDKVITVNPGQYVIGDSLVGFYDNTYQSFYVYYDHDKFTLESNVINNPLVSFRASNNTLAFVNQQREFKIFWNGGVQKIFQLSPGMDLDYQTGSNVVAFISGVTNSLGVFYKGQTFNVSNIPVKEYKAADDMVAYTDQNGLHAFYAGKNYDLLSAYDYTYDVSDSVLVYYTSGYFRVFNKGKVTILGNYKPAEYALDNNTVAWINQQGGLSAFFNDNIYDLTGFDRVMFRLEGNCLWYKSQTSSNQVFLCGKKY